ncbi:hypothetical protein BDA99DRAFT_572256, partial [Phascolomyces articulosus]
MSGTNIGLIVGIVIVGFIIIAVTIPFLRVIWYISTRTICQLLKVLYIFDCLYFLIPNEFTHSYDSQDNQNNINHNTVYPSRRRGHDPRESFICYCNHSICLFQWSHFLKRSFFLVTKKTFHPQLPSFCTTKETMNGTSLLVNEKEYQELIISKNNHLHPVVPLGTYQKQSPMTTNDMFATTTTTSINSIIDNSSSVIIEELKTSARRQDHVSIH